MGAFYLNPAAVEPTRYILRQIEGVESGDMFWAYRRELADCLDWKHSRSTAHGIDAM